MHHPPTTPKESGVAGLWHAARERWLGARSSLRLSAGIEHIDDNLADPEQALKAADEAQEAA